MSVRARILARHDLMGLREARDLDGLAGALNAEGLSALAARYVTTRTILDECEDGRTIVAAIQSAAGADPTVAEALHFLRDDSGFDVGHPRTQAMVRELQAAGVFTQAQADQLCAMGLSPVVVDRLEVEAALFNPDGSEK